MQKKTETDRQTDRQTDRDRQTETDRQIIHFCRPCRVLVVACLLPTVGISTVFACWAWKRTEHLSSCRDIPFDVFRRFPFLVASISVEISLVLTLVLAYTLLYLGVFKSRRKALNGNLTFAQFIR